VSRTADDLLRYHGKWMVVDGRELYVLAFNFCYPDIERSRSFGVITQNRAAIREALRLFDCDTARQPYEAGCENFLVSPVNARQSLAKFIAGTKRELLIYDPKVSDPAMLRCLLERSKAGVQVRLIGRVSDKRPESGWREVESQIRNRGTAGDGGIPARVGCGLPRQ
jgi:hypothetical protein